MEFEFNWLSGFRGEKVDVWTDSGVTGILIAHLRAFGSGKLKTIETSTICDELRSCFENSVDPD